VPWSCGSGPLVTLTNCKPNHALFTAFSSARRRWNYNENGRKLPPPLPDKFHRLRALSTSREKNDFDYIAEPLENPIQTKLESPKNCFTKEAWLLTVGRDITCLKLRYDILLILFVVCSLLGWGPFSLSLLVPQPNTQRYRNQLRSGVANLSKSGVFYLFFSYLIIFISLLRIKKYLLCKYN